MKYNINHKHKVVFFWAPKSGVMSLIRLMSYLKLSNNFTAGQLAAMSNKALYKMYKNDVFEPWNEKVDYKPFKKIFFGRNPYHRIISCYIDKYVNPNSKTPSHVPDCKSYLGFIQILNETGLSKEKMTNKVDFGHFCSVTNDIGWQLYTKLGNPDFDMFSLLPATGLPEGNLTHDFRNIKSLFEILGISTDYSSVKELYENHTYSYDTWLQQDPHSLLKVEGLAELGKEELWEFMKSKKSRTISYASFYTHEITKLFHKIYHTEIKFYADRNYTFVPD